MKGPARTCGGCLYFQPMDSETGRCGNRNAEGYQRGVIRFGVAPRFKRGAKGCNSWEDARSLRPKVLALDAQQQATP